MPNHVTAYELCPCSDSVTIASLETRYEAGETVTYNDDGDVGLVIEVHTDDFEFQTGEDESTEVSASDDSPVYVVAQVAGGTQLYRASDLESIDEDEAFAEVDVEEPEQQIADAEMSAAYRLADEHGLASVAELSDLPGVDMPGIGWDSYPPSWEEADAPARLILLDAWTSMNANFDGCVREMRGEMTTPQDFCASMADEVYQTTYWR